MRTGYKLVLQTLHHLHLNRMCSQLSTPNVQALHFSSLSVCKWVNFYGCFEADLLKITLSGGNTLLLLSNHTEQTSATLVAKVRWFVVKPLVSVPQSLYPWTDLALAQGLFPCCVCVSLSSQQGVIWG